MYINEINEWEETQEINLHIYNQFIINKGAKDIQLEKNTFLNKLHWKNWILPWARIKLYPYLTNVYSQSSKDFSIKYAM